MCHSAPLEMPFLMVPFLLESNFSDFGKCEAASDAPIPAQSSEASGLQENVTTKI